ncbi:MAG: efflux RND transporter periplasmic adaptor subunit [Planctomycetales bacterium]
MRHPPSQRGSRFLSLWGVGSAALCGLILFLTAPRLLLSQDAKEVSELKSGPIIVERPYIQFLDKAILSSSRIGTIERIDVREGDLVKAGQIVVQLRDEVPRANYLTAKQTAENTVEIRYSYKAAELATVEHERAVEANKRVRHAFPDIEVDRLRLTAEKSILQIEQAKHQQKVDSLKRDEAFEVLKTFRIEAQMDGIITKVNKVTGESVREGDPLVEMVNTDRVKVEGYVHVNQSVRLKRGQLVEVHIDIPEEDLDVEKEVFEGTLVFVDLFTRPDDPQVRVWAEVKNRDGVLREGLRASMKILPDKQGPRFANPHEKKPEAKQPLPPPKEELQKEAPKKPVLEPLPKPGVKTAGKAKPEPEFEPPVRVN